MDSEGNELASVIGPSFQSRTKLLAFIITSL